MPLLTTGRVARMLDASETTVRHMARRGELPCVVTESGIRLFQRVDVERLAAERQARRDARSEAK